MARLGPELNESVISSVSNVCADADVQQHRNVLEDVILSIIDSICPKTFFMLLPSGGLYLFQYMYIYGNC